MVTLERVFKAIPSKVIRIFCKVLLAILVLPNDVGLIVDE